MKNSTPTNQHFRDVHVISSRKPTEVIRVYSDAEIDAYDALNAAERNLPAPQLGECRYLKVYCGGSN
jgi:hypothetical protein